MAYAMASFRQPMDGSRADVVAAVAAFLLANPNALVVDMSVSRQLSPRDSERLVIRLLYQTTGGFAYTFTLIEGSAATPLEDAYAAFVVANSVQYPLLTLDLSSRLPRAVDFGAIAALTTGQAPHASNAVYVGEAFGDIAAGAMGVCKIYDAAGVLLALIPVTNVSSAFLWPDTQRNLVVYDPDTNGLIGIPSCSGTGSPLP